MHQNSVIDRGSDYRDSFENHFLLKNIFRFRVQKTNKLMIDRTLPKIKQYFTVIKNTDVKRKMIDKAWKSRKLVIVMGMPYIKAIEDNTQYALWNLWQLPLRSIQNKKIQALQSVWNKKPERTRLSSKMIRSYGRDPYDMQSTSRGNPEMYQGQQKAVNVLAQSFEFFIKRFEEFSS